AALSTEPGVAPAATVVATVVGPTEATEVVGATSGASVLELAPPTLGELLSEQALKTSSSPAPPKRNRAALPCSATRHRCGRSGLVVIVVTTVVATSFRSFI